MSHDGGTYFAQRARFFAELADANVRRAPDFHAGGLMDWSPAERGNELAGEVGELCNELKKLLRFDNRHGIHWHPINERWEMLVDEDTWEAVPPELADQRAEIVNRIRDELGDGVICLSLVARMFNIDLLGDGVICLSLVARMFNIDLEQATRDKFNLTSVKIGSKVLL